MEGIRKVPKNSPVMSSVKLTPTFRPQPGKPGPYAECESDATEMAESPRMVMRLKGSMTFLVASHPFPLGVSGLTCGPFENRLYQSINSAGQGFLSHSFLA